MIEHILRLFLSFTLVSNVIKITNLTDLNQTSMSYLIIRFLDVLKFQSNHNSGA